MTETKLPDVNVLVALFHPNHAAHAVVWEWFSSTTSFATTPITETGLLRLALNPKVMGSQVAPSDAMRSLRSLRSDPRAVFIPDDASLAEATTGLDGLRGHRQVTDLHLVNLAARHQMVVVTLDRALARSLPSYAHSLVKLLA